MRWAGVPKRGWWRAGTVAAVAVAAVMPAVGLAQPAASSPKVVGNPAAGKPTFVSTCGVCHTLAAAGSAGTIGPNLDKVKLTEAQIVKATANGGASIMTKAALAKYPTKMAAYKGTLTSKEIQDVAAYVYTSSKATASTKGKITVQTVDPTGKVHPVQYGTSKKNIVHRAFTGSFSSFVAWPASSRRVPLMFRVTVVTGTRAKAVNAVVSYRVTPK